MDTLSKRRRVENLVMGWWEAEDEKTASGLRRS